MGKTYSFSSIKTLFLSRFHRASRWSTLNSKKNEKKNSWHLSGKQMGTVYKKHIKIGYGMTNFFFENSRSFLVIIYPYFYTFMNQVLAYTYQSSKGTFLQFVSGVYFFTIFFSNVHLVIGHLVHSSLVEYPWVTSWHFSSNSSLHEGWSSSTSCSWYLWKYQNI